jgi:MFS transporter, DHA2 family, methylenomycin A resistance protein
MPCWRTRPGGRRSAGLFLAVLSTTLVSVALPTIGRDLHASATDQEWTVDAYVLVYASLLVAGGVAGDHRGRKGTFILGVALFGLGSLAAGLAPSTGLLLAGRALQGTGPALLIPGSLAIIRATFADDRQRSFAVGLWSTGSGVAMAVGPALGGVIVGALAFAVIDGQDRGWARSGVTSRCSAPASGCAAHP